MSRNWLSQKKVLVFRTISYSLYPRLLPRNALHTQQGTKERESQGPKASLIYVERTKERSSAASRSLFVNIHFFDKRTIRSFQSYAFFTNISSSSVGDSSKRENVRYRPLGSILPARAFQGSQSPHRQKKRVIRAGLDPATFCAHEISIRIAVRQM